ncbi:MAG: glycosyltransferase family 39 protein [Microbacteriaceae bacterium]
MNATTRVHDSSTVALSPGRPRWYFSAVVGVVAVFAALVSLAGSWIPSLWGDEAASVMSATRDLPSLVRMLGTVDAVHGTYYLGLHFWIELFGTSPFSVRFPSAVAVGVMVAGVMVIARRLGSARVAVAAGILCAVIPRVTYMGAEARSSALAAAFATWLTVVLLQLIDRRQPSQRLWLAYAGLLAVGIYVFLYLILIAVAHAVILLIVRTDAAFLRRWTRTVLASTVVAAPVIIAALLQRNQIAFLGHRSEVTPPKIAITLWFGEPLFAAVAWLLIVVACVATFRARAARSDFAAERMPRLGVVAACWLLVPSVILIAAFPIVPIYTARYLSYCAPAAGILMALGLDWLLRHNRGAMAVALVVIALCAAPAWVAQRQPNAKNNSDFAQTSAIIAAHATQGDAVVFDESVRPSRRPRLALHLYSSAYAGLRDVTLDRAYDAGSSWYDSTLSVHDAQVLGRFNGVSRVWLTEYSAPTRHDASARRGLQQLGFTAVHEFVTHRSVIYELVRPEVRG